jgi:NAD(P)-dependent dehydrogenase (short-subunit alcohol dehydrogenase family)
VKLARALDALLDASILFSFDRSGFERHARRFRAQDLELDASGRVALVTGANSGIGREAARALAARGAEVWLLCRNEARGCEAERALRAETGSSQVHFAPLDVADLAAVKHFAASFPGDRVDVLVHNAGLIPAARTLTRDGLELCFATHVAGPLALTQALETRLGASAGRVIFVSSGGMYAQRLSLHDLGWSERAYDGVVAYAQTKRMQVVLAELLAEELGGSGISVNAMHPGWAATPGVESSLPRFWKLMQGRLRTPEQGADTVVWLALAHDAARTSGALWFDRARVRTHLVPWTRERPRERQQLRELAFRAAAGKPPSEASRAPAPTRAGGPQP